MCISPPCHALTHKHAHQRDDMTCAKLAIPDQNERVGGSAAPGVGTPGVGTPPAWCWAPWSPTPPSGDVPAIAASDRPSIVYPDLSDWLNQSSDGRGRPTVEKKGFARAARGVRGRGVVGE